MKDNVLAVFDTLFEGRRDVYGLHNPEDDQITMVNDELSILEFKDHLVQGTKSLAVYPVTREGICHWACIDFDYARDPNKAIEVAKAVQATLTGAGVTSWLEKSKGKGGHVWIFFSEPVPAQLARALLNTVLKLNPFRGEGFSAEIFPKQENVAAGKFGNCLNIPYYAPQVSEGKRVVINPETNQVLAPEEFAEKAFRSRVSIAQVRIALGQVLESLEERNISKTDKPSNPLSVPSNIYVDIVDIFAPNWKEGCRQFLAMGLSGFLAKKNFSLDSVIDIIQAIGRRTNDNELTSRLRVARDTFNKLREGEKVAGITLLSQHLPDETVERIRALFPKPTATFEELDEPVIQLVQDVVTVPPFTSKPPSKGLVGEVVNFLSRSTDANSEVLLSAALGLISLLIGRRLILREGLRTTFTNLYLLLVGNSSDARKSTIMELTTILSNIVIKLVPHKFLLPITMDPETRGLRQEATTEAEEIASNPVWKDGSSPEAFQQKMALVSSVSRDTTFMVFTDEAGTYLDEIQKVKYKANALGMILKIYDCPRMHDMERRENSKYQNHAAFNIYCNWFFATTPETLTNSSSELLKQSGFFQRQLTFIIGPREKEYEDFQDKISNKELESSELIYKLASLVSDTDMEAEISDKAKAKFRVFAKELRKFREDNPNLLESKFVARLDTMTKKLSMINEMCLRVEQGQFTIGDPYYSEERPKVLEISEEAMDRAIELAYYFLDATKYMCTHFFSNSDFLSKRRIVIDAMLRNNGLMKQSELLCATKLHLKELDQILETMVARKEVSISSPRSKKGHRYLPYYLDRRRD